MSLLSVLVTEVARSLYYWAVSAAMAVDTNLTSIRADIGDKS